MRKLVARASDCAVPGCDLVNGSQGRRLAAGGSTRTRALAVVLPVLACVLLALPSAAAATPNGSISGMVTDAASTQPIEFDYVCVYDASGYEWESVACGYTDSSGEYTIEGLEAGSYKVRFYAPYESGDIEQFYDGKSSWAEADVVHLAAEEARSGVDAELEKGGEVTGTVVDAGTKAPIESANVCAYDAGGPEWESVACGYTDSGGEYTIEGLAAGSYKVQFVAPYGSNYLSRYYDGQASFAKADPIAVGAGEAKPGIDAELQKGGEVTGTVTDAESHEPIEGISVCPYKVGLGGGYGGACTSTDSSGEYTLSGLAMGTYTVRFEAPYYGALNYLSEFYGGKQSLGQADTFAVAPEETTTGVDAELEPGGQISGTVTDASTTEPIELANVCVYRSGSGEYVTCVSTNSGGEYTVSRLATGSYRVQFSPPHGRNYVRQYYDTKATYGAANPVAVNVGETKAGIDAELEPGGQISGTVTDASTAEPIEFANVCAYNAGNGRSEGCATANAGGEYTLSSLATGSYKVQFSPPSGGNYLSQWFDGKPTFGAGASLAVAAGAVTEGIDAELQKGGEVTGTVTDAESDEPIEDGRVCAYEGESASYVGCVYTNVSGEYALVGLATGSYKVQFSPPYGGNYLSQYYDGKPSFAEADPIAVSVGETTSGIDAELEKGGEVTGTVTDAESDEPIKDVNVCLYEGESGSYLGCAYTNGGGEYAIGGLASGAYVVRFETYEGNYLSQYYDGKPSFAAADRVAVTTGATTAGVDAELEPGGQIAGNVSDETTAEPIEEARVCVRDPGSGEQIACGYTNFAGDYVISGLPAGEYAVRFDPPYGANYIGEYFDDVPTMAESAPVSTELGMTTEGIDAELALGGQIRGEVTAAVGGEPLSGAYVCATKVGGGEGGSCTETEFGEYTISGLATGSYRVQFSPPYEGNYLGQYYDDVGSAGEADPVAVEAGSVAEGIDAALHPGGQISGTVTDASTAEPIEGASVCASGVGEYGHCVSTGAGGEYTISSLPTGSFNVTFSPGYACGPEECASQNYVRQYYDGKSSFGEADPVSVTAGSTHSGIDAEMERGGKISGHVTDAITAEPLGSVQVCASPTAGEETEICDETNIAGAYTVQGLPAGSYRVRFSPSYSSNLLSQYYDGRSSIGEADPVSVTAGSTHEEVDAALEHGGQIKGHVTVAPSGESLQGIEVCAFNSGAEGPTRCTSTNYGGNYVLQGLPTGSYQVEFGPGYVCGFEGCAYQNYIRQYYDGKASFGEADPVSVTVGSTQEGIDAELEVGGRISGTVIDASSEVPVRWSWVCAYRSGEEEPEACSESNGSGHYVITGLSEGNYKVEFGPGATCTGEFVCIEHNYLVQFYDNKASLAAADDVSVTVGGNHEGIDASLVESSGSKPVSTEAPQLTGTPEVGETLTCSNGSWENSPTGFDRVWLRGSSPIAGETEATYEVQAADRGHTIACEVTASNEGGSASETSDGLYVPAPPVNTAPPVLSGVPAVGETLTCSDGSWENSPTGYDRVWLRGASPIAGETEATYEVQAADQGHSITCKVTATNADGSADETSNSLAVPAAAGAPVDTETPQLTGTPELSMTLSCSQGLWENSPTEYAYSWLRDGSPIAGGTEATYEVQAADAGHEISCEVTASNGLGSASASSNALAVVPKPVNTGPPSIVGTPEVGMTLTCSDGSWKNSPTDYAYSWRRDGSPIAGKTASTYEVQAADASHGLTCRVTASNGGGSTGATSGSVEVPIPPSPPVNTVKPQLTGTPGVGQTLSCSQGLWENSPTEYAIAWLRDGSPIAGQAGTTYTVQSADQGHAITCKVTAGNGGGAASESSNSLTVPAPESKPQPESNPQPSSTPPLSLTKPHSEPPKATYGQCVAKANKTYRKAKKAAERKHGKARATAMKQARKKKGKLTAKCKKRFGKSHGKQRHKHKRGRRAARH